VSELWVGTGAHRTYVSRQPLVCSYVRTLRRIRVGTERALQCVATKERRSRGNPTSLLTLLPENYRFNQRVIR
jgi:hypothetical protein